jgi:hypothetical protein
METNRRAGSVKDLLGYPAEAIWLEVSIMI